MKVTEIVVSAGRTFNHPHETYSNLRPAVTIKASIEKGEDYQATVKALQAQAEQLVEDHKQHCLKSLDEMYYLTERQKEVEGLQASIAKAQSRLDNIREQYADTPLTDFAASSPLAIKSLDET